MEFKYLLLETNDGVATLTINRPEALNALNSRYVTELECALFELNLDAAVKVVVITGAGEKAFVAGADIKEMCDLSSFAAHAFMRTGQRVMLLIEKMKKPVIAAVNGFALGGGLELALACDFIYASEKAKLGFPKWDSASCRASEAPRTWPGLIGPKRAKELIFTGKMITAQKALSWGIVNEVFAPEELMAKTLETAREIAAKGTLGVRYSKDSVANGLNMAKEDGFRYEASLLGVLFSTEDQREGMGAFIEKRKAEFQGK